MKLGQLIEWTWETFFLKNQIQNMVGNLFADPFLKNQNWAYVWINSLKFYTVFFSCMSRSGLSKYVETDLQTTYFYHIPSFFEKQKVVSFSACFLTKNIYVLILYYLTKFPCLVAFSSWYIGKYVYCNCLLARLWRHKFWN